MNTRYATRGLLLSVTVNSGCWVGERQQFDLDTPRLVATSIDDGEPIAVTDALWITFSEPMQISAPNASVAIVPDKQGETCTANLTCDEGQCWEGRCQHVIVSEAWASDLANPPLSEAREKALAAVRVSLELDDKRLRIEPLFPLLPGTLYSLILSPDLRDRNGNELAAQPSDEPWILRFSTSRGTEQPIVTLREPSPGTTDLPANLGHVLFTFSRAVEGLNNESVWLEDRRGQRISGTVHSATVRCQKYDSARCYEWRPQHHLPLRSELRLVISPSVADSHGRSVVEREEQWIAIGEVMDYATPNILTAQWDVADGCLMLRLSSDEVTELLIRSPLFDQPIYRSPSTEHEVEVVDPSSGSHPLEVVLTDWAENRVDRVDEVIVPEVPRIAISEVLANPRGKEPDQEWIELVNLSERSQTLNGWVLSGTASTNGGFVLPTTLLPAGAYALVVGPKYVPMPGSDPVALPGTTTISLNKNLSLVNRGAPLYLFSANRTLVSRYLGNVNASSGENDGRSVERVPVNACGATSAWKKNSFSTSTPGRPPSDRDAR